MPAVNIETIHGQFKKVRNHYYKLLEGFELEEIHDFRLEMKRLRSFVRLLNTNITDTEKLKVPEALNTFYACVFFLKERRLIN